MYYRESFEYSPIKMFFNSNSADTIVSRGNVTFNLQRNINLPNNVIAYVSLNDFIVANTDYNINDTNNTLVLQDHLGVSQSITITKGNYTVSSLMTALNARFAALVGNNFANVTVTYSDITNMYTFKTAANTTYSLTFLATSTMNAVLGFEPGLVNNSIPNAIGSTLKTTVQKNAGITFTAANNTINIDFPGLATKSYSIFAGGPYSLAAIATYVNTNLFTGNNINVTCTYDAVTQVFTFSNTTTNSAFTLSGSLLPLIGFDSGIVNYNISKSIATTCTLTSTKIVDLSGNNAFYVTSDLTLANYSFLNPKNKGGSNVLGKVQLTTSQTGIEFHKDISVFKTRFYNNNLSSIHFVLYDEDFNQWVPLSDWSCVLEMTFYEKYDLTTKLKTNNLLFSK